MQGGATVIGARTGRDPETVAAPATVDVGIVGAGLCGSLLALVLARRGVSVAVVDLHAQYQTDFRCEKVSPDQIALLEALGVADVLHAAFPWAGGLHKNGFRYETMVNAIRAAWPSSVSFIPGRVMDVAADGSHQRIVGADGDLARARLAVIASGASPALISRLGLERRTVREGQSICIGFTLTTDAGAPLPFNNLVHPGERLGDQIGFASFFPLDGATRVNLFTYHPPTDPWVRQARQAPLDALLEVAPGLRPKLEGVRLIGDADIRVTHLHRLLEPGRPGLVVIGDAFQTCCPSTAFGVTRLLTDIGQLVERVPEWLLTPGMSEAKIAAFYADPVKRRVDRRALAIAERARKAATETSLVWRLHRHARRLKRGLTRPPIPAAAQAPVPAPAPAAKGDRIRVRSAAEILSTLDSQGRLHGMPFMPEMIAFIGETLTVRRRADQTCVEGLGLRSLPQTVFLDGARCDGKAHAGCQRGCALFWNEAWLTADEDALPIDPAAEAQARQRLLAFPVRQGDQYACQSTALAAATGPAPGMRILLDDLERGELAPPRLIEILLRSVARKALALIGRGEFGSLKGKNGKTIERLGLKPGERVRVKSPPRIAATLNANGRNRGMTFEPEMTVHTGRIYTVAGPVEQMIHEETGRMVRLEATVTLEGVDCLGRCTRNCPRANPLFWREAWLERVDGAASPSQAGEQQA